MPLVLQLKQPFDFAPSQSVEPPRNVLVAGLGGALPANVCAGLFQARLMLVRTPPHPSKRGERCRILCRGPCDAHSRLPHSGLTVNYMLTTTSHSWFRKVV